MNTDYILPILSVHSNFDEAKSFHDNGEGLFNYGENAKPLEIKDLIQGKRNLIVGEPGIGKTSLLHRIEEFFREIGHYTAFISLRQADSVARIDSFLQEASRPRALLMDALDEVQSKTFSEILNSLERVSKDNPDLPIFLSSRWVFISNYRNAFPEYRFITVSPFSQIQVKRYLKNKGHSEKDITQLLDKVSAFNKPSNILQVPRYLSFLNNFLDNNKDVAAAKKISRNELFEYFIYSTLDAEARKAGDDKRAITKRLLEKLALTMEIYQTNVITQDELMTFFDEIDSDLKVIALAQFNLHELFDRSLLKTSPDSIEFENSEFQEYLAAKEVTRLADPNRATFSIAVDHNIEEIYPTWFNSLSFLVDMESNLLEQLVEFSGLRAREFKVVDEELLTFISKVNPDSLSVEVRRRIFNDVIAYHKRTLLWLPWNLSGALAGFYDSSLESTLKDWVENADSRIGAERFVSLGNAVSILIGLLEAEISIDGTFWRARLIRFASEVAENTVLQRNALHAIEALRDPSVIEELPDLVGADQLVSEAFLSMCAAVAPDNGKSVGYFIDAVSRDIYQGRYGLFKIRKAEAINRVLVEFVENEKFANAFLREASIFNHGEDRILVDNIENVIDDEMDALSRKVVISVLQPKMYPYADNSEFIVALVKMLAKRKSDYFRAFVTEISNSENGTGIHYAQHALVDALEVKDIPDFLDAMHEVGQDLAAFHVLRRIKASKRDCATDIYESGREKLSQLYEDWEAQPRTETIAQSKNELIELRALMEPVPGQFNRGVFHFFNSRFKELSTLIESKDRSRLIELLTGTVFKFIDPTKVEISIAEAGANAKTTTYSANIPLFGSAILTAKLLGFDVTPYRQQIIDFIPFAFDNDLKTVFELVKSVKVGEMSFVLSVYKQRQSDLWRHQPLSFVNAVERFHIVEAVGVLKEMVEEKTYDRHTRERAMAVIDSVAPDVEYLRTFFKVHVSATGDDRQLACTANSFLISSHADTASVRWRLREVVNNRLPYVEPTTAHIVSAGEDELWGKAFAKPLMQLKQSGFEEDFLSLLEEAISLWRNGRQFHAYAQYLWEITYSCFDNLKLLKSYEPLRKLEVKIARMQGKEGANWLAARMVHLRRSYLSSLGKPRNISEAVKKYNVARSYDSKKIVNAEDLFRQVQDALDTELRRWIEGEGAYQLIRGEKIFKRKQEYEDLIQKTLKTQVENILLRRGLQLALVREPQLLDGKRVDILLTYGFVGPVVLEIKLTSNSDLKKTKLGETKSYESMRRYMSGYGAPHGIFLVIDNNDATNLAEIASAYQQIPNVLVQSFSCRRLKS